MISIGALFAIVLTFAKGNELITTKNDTANAYNDIIDQLTSVLNSNRTLDDKEFVLLNQTARNLGIDSDIIDKLAEAVSKGNVNLDLVTTQPDSKPSYNVYGDKEESGVGPIEESPDYASSVVLASDLLSITRAVTNIKDSVCRAQGYKFLDGLLLKKRWALKMFDASAKSPQGLLFGSTYHLGNYDECVEIKDFTEGGPMVAGQYCLATIDWPGSKAAQKIRDGRGGVLRWAVCVPSTCDANSVSSFVSDIIANTIGTNITVTVNESDCSNGVHQSISKTDVGYLIFILLFSTIILLCSTYEFFAPKLGYNKWSRLREFILCFSIINNVKKIISTKQNTSLGLECIAGIKAVAMCLILFGHACMFTISGPVMNPESIVEINQMPIYALMLNSVLLVDTFLLLSAFLFARLLFIELDKRKGKLNVLPILLFRYIRVTPAYLMVILFYITWLPKIGDGPLWKSRMAQEQQRCADSWWTNLLYINNYVNTKEMCMFQSWYLSVDTQMFFIAPFFIFSLWHWRRIGPVLVGIAVLISMVIPSVITYKDSLDPTFLIYASELKDIVSNYYFNTAYIKTHMKMTPYFIGLLTGYIVHEIQTNNYRLTKLTKILGWTINFILGTSAVFSVSVFYQQWYQYSRLDATAYISLHKLAWGLANGWLIIACTTGNGGLFQQFFSWKFLMPISRLTYCAYLANGIVELYFVSTIQQPIYYSALNLGATAIAHVIMTFTLATLLCVTFESPIHGFEKMLLKVFDHRVISDNVRKEASRESSRSTSQSKIDS